MTINSTNDQAVTADGTLGVPNDYRDHAGPTEARTATSPEQSPTSAKQIAANQRNAKKSTGPRTDGGKARSAFNAMTHGIYSRSHPIERGVLEEDPDEVSDFVDGLIDDLAPRDTQELVVARRIAEGELRLARTDRYESVGLSAAGRITEYQATQGIGQEETILEFGLSFLGACDVVSGRRVPNEKVGWREVANHIWLLRGTPSTEFDFPTDGDGTEVAFERERIYVYTVLIPRFWKSYEGAVSALEAKGEELIARHNETVGVAEELAVEKALAPGGVMDRASLLRSRSRRDLERDRATYAQLRRRELGEGCDDNDE